MKSDHKYQIAIVLVSLFFLLELIFSLYANSLALQSDAIHMLGDLVALMIGYWSSKVSSRSKSHEFTYGWVRAPVIGGLINSVFLISACFFLFLEVVQRFVALFQLAVRGENLALNPDNFNLSQEINLVLIAAGAGLFINLAQLAVFHNHHHHHHPEEQISKKDVSKDTPEVYPEEKDSEKSELRENDIESDLDSEVTEVLEVTKNYNHEAIWLHVLADTFGSILVIIGGIIIKYVDADWKFYLDPIGSLLIILMIGPSSFKLAKKCWLLLMHQSPPEIRLSQMLRRIEKIAMVDSIHHFHIWPLTPSVCNASLHIKMKQSGEQGTSVDQVISQIKAIFHQFGIHSSTIQPEWSETCLDSCQSSCQEKQCCQENPTP